ncbi:MAG: DUF4230 domain-containing protein [Chitinophagales bacterium]|nr:DUF4230 domain-containing protein [Chitinophagales bacterium]
MKKLFLILGMLALILFVFLYFRNEEAKKEEQASIILEKIEEVQKLILVEGSFAEVYTYKQEENLFFDLFPVEKKVIVVIKAKASIAYDLSLVDFSLDKEKQKVIIKGRPKEQIIIEPKIQYYDIQQSKFYPLSAKDFSSIQARAVELIEDQVRASTLPQIASDRLGEVLEQIIFTSENLGWETIQE